ncbi:MAG: tetratricopeptide repeat protein [Deltaproteobacteria bacterium]|nr:tetratricopeptide repeat protein [Deltaproteobacteria bacterium]
MFMRSCAFVAAAAVVCVAASGAAQAGPKDAKRAPVVAVLPFKVLNKEAALAHYGEGASDTIINKIVNDKALKVVEESQLDKAVNALARNQTGLFEEDSALAIGQMVDARYIVIGSVQLVGDDKSGQIKVNARVLEVETRQLLVSESVFGPVAAAFQQYEEIGARLVSKMTNHLSQRTEGASADSVAVNSLIDEGKAFDPAFPPAPGVAKDLSKALTAYNKAVLRDPKSARAYLALGHGELRLAEDQQRVDPTRSRQTLMTCREHLKRSAELDGQNPFAWTQLGRAEGRLLNHSGAGEAFQRALALDSHFVAARFGLAVALLSMGELDAARDQAAQARAAGDGRADGLLKSIDTQLALKKEKPSAAAHK